MKFGTSYRPVSYLIEDHLWMREFNFYDGFVPLINIFANPSNPAQLTPAQVALVTFNLANGYMVLGPNGKAVPTPALIATNMSAIQSFDLGIPVAFRQGFGNPRWNGWGHNLGVFAQDSWKVANNLTVDFGGRIDYSAEASPIPHHVFFSPRLGFAWSPGGNRKTVIRGGGGVFVAPVPFYNDYILNLLGGSGKYINQFAAVVNPDKYSFDPTKLWRYGLQTGKLPFGQLLASDLNNLGFQVPGQANLVIVNTNRDFQNVQSIQASLSVQRELVRNLSLEVAYQMYHGLHQQIPIDTNVVLAPCDAPPFNLTSVIDPFAGPCYKQINPNYAQIETYSSVGSSIYHGVTASLTRQFSHGLQFQVNYTFSKAIDDNTDFNNNFMPFRPTQINLERGISAFNIKHNFVANAVYSTPVKPGGNILSRVFADMSISPILAMRTGIPFTLRVPSLQNGTLAESLYARPWNAGRNTGIGPNFYGLDMRVTKSLYIRRDPGLKVDLLVEGTNLLNRTNFSAVNDMFPADPAYVLPNGKTLATGPYEVHGLRASDPLQPLAFKSAFDPRQLQFGIKLVF